MDRIQTLARQQLSDYDAHRPGMEFTDPELELSVEEAYRVQFEVARLRVSRGEGVAGFKIGCVSEAIQRQLGIDRPVFGHVWRSELHASGAVLQLDRFDHLAIEGELAVRVGDGGGPDAVFAVIELHNNVFRRLRVTPEELIANNAIHAGVVLSGAGACARKESISVFRNGVLLGAAAASPFAGGPAEAVERVRQHLREWGQALEPGHIVLTGTSLPLFSVASGDRIEVRTEGGAAVAASVC